MASIEKMSIALPAEMVAGVKAAVASGEYATASEVIRDALRDWKLKRRVTELELGELGRLVGEGAESGPALEAETVFARLRARYVAMESAAE